MSDSTTSVSTESNGETTSEHIDGPHRKNCPGNLCARFGRPRLTGAGYEEMIDSVLHDFCSDCSSQPELEPLCDFCKHLRFRHLGICIANRYNSLFIEFDLDYDGLWSGISRIVSNKGCALCSVLAKAIHSHFAMTKKPGEDEEDIQAKTGLKLQLSQIYYDHRLTLYFTGGKSGKVEITYRQPGQEPSPTIEGQIKWSAVKEWIRKCSDHTQCAKSESFAVPQGFRLIDVEDRKVVSDHPHGSRIGRDIKYVALSYVWGTTVASRGDALLSCNEHELAAPSGLDGIHLPRAIEDAMVVCQRLGQRFLWVDRFCIRQDDDGLEKQAQINAMGNIYSSAEFTIIHASGTSMHDPIAGVSTTREVYQHMAVVCGLEFIIAYPDIKVALRASTWVERGWTYQEAVLSRRKLFFTPFELWFECNDSHDAYQREDRYSINRSSPFLKSFQKSELEQYRLSNYAEDTAKAQDFVRHLTAYTCRSLTQRSDILDAFQGILNTLYTDSPITCGLPEADLDQAILWYCVNQHILTVNANGFPSWAWASASQAVTAPVVSSYNSFCETLVQWFYKNQAGELKPVRAERALPPAQRFLLTDISAQISLLIAWWKGCIEPEILEDVKQMLEKIHSACRSSEEAQRPSAESIWKHVEGFGTCHECKSLIAQRWPNPEGVWADIQKARNPGLMETKCLEAGKRLSMEKPRPGVLVTRAQTAQFRVFMDVRLQSGDLLQTRLYLTDSKGQRVGMLKPYVVDMTLQTALDNTMPELSQGYPLECMGISLTDSGHVSRNDISDVSDQRCEQKHHLRELATSAMSATKSSSSHWYSCGGPAVNVLIIRRQEGSPFARRIGVGSILFEDWLKADRTFSTIALE